MAYRLGVDIGGTFTDFCAFEEASGTVKTLKVLSRPDAPGAEITSGLEELLRRHNIAPEQITTFTHGTTVGVNTVIQRSGARTCLFVTQGFEEVLELARLKMPDPYNLFSTRAAPLVPRERVFGICERTLADGSIDTEIDEESVEAALAGVRAEAGESIVIALLHAYANPDNERRLREMLQDKAPELTITLASDVWPVIREYERTVTAVVGGYVQAKVTHYLTRLEQALSDSGVPATPMITKSNGGVMNVALGKKDCVSILLSGTASGVMAAAHIAGMCDAGQVLSLDVGGTSADVAIIRDGKPQFGQGEMVGEFPIFVPSVAVSSIGEGGGSVIWVDRLGGLKVGPESAGSSPGPACYGRGGLRPTITDAFAVLGYLGTTDLGYSAVKIDVEKAHAAFETIIKPLGMTVKEAAEAAIQIAVSGMYLEISKLFSHAADDPREFALLAFGGAGPMVANFVAEELGIEQVIVPPAPGVLSAFGGIIADIRNDFIRTAYIGLNDEGMDTLLRLCSQLEEEASHWLHQEQGYEQEARMYLSADMRYLGQSYEIETTLEKAWLESADAGAIAEAFHHQHENIYDHADRDAPVQIINVRVVIIGSVAKPKSKHVGKAKTQAKPISKTVIYRQGVDQAALVYDRTDLEQGHSIIGPAIIVQDDTTTCLLDSWQAKVDIFGNLIITQED